MINKIHVIFLLFLLLFLTQNIHGQAPKWKYEDLKSYTLHYQETTLLVVNFWATWCRPCIEELPYFANIDSRQEVKVLLVSIDFTEDAPEKVARFIDKKQIKQQVVVMDEMNFNEWMPRVSKEWSGSIPATWIIRTSDQNSWFYEKSFNLVELNQIINSHLTK